MFTIRQDQTVLQHVHLHDIVHIDDKPLADAGEKHIMSGQARFQGLEHLRQVHAHLALQLVGQHDIGIVAVGFEIHDS